MNEPEQAKVRWPARRPAVQLLSILAWALPRMRVALRLWPLLLPALILVPAVPAFPYPSRVAPYSDITISHYPNAVYLIQALREWRSLPLWSPAILSGHPFFADPLSGLWYPPGWLALLFPLPAGFNLVVILHLLWGGLGMYLLLRSEGGGFAGALFAALAFQSMPKFFAHYGAGHLTLLYALHWTPWLLLAERQTGRSGSSFPVWRPLLQPGVVLALIFLADPRWAAFSLALWWCYCIAHRHAVKQTLSHLASQTGLAALLAAPLALPLLEYARPSTRAALSPQEVLAFSLPWPRLLGLVFPDFGGFHEWALYPGGAVLALGLAALVLRVAPRQKVFYSLVFLFSILVSLGSQLLPLSLLAELPGVALLRVPARALFLAGLALAALSGMALDRLLGGPEACERRRVTRLLTGLCGFALALSGGVWILSGALPINFAWGIAVLLLVTLWLSVLLLGWLRPRRRLAGLIVIALLDLGVVNSLAFAPRSAAEVFTEGDAVARYLAERPGVFRVYSPSYSLPQHTASRYRLEQVDGVNPMQLESYAGFMERASGVPRSGYSVTMPPFQTGRPDQDNAGYRPDPQLLAILNTGYVLAEFDLEVAGLDLLERFGNTRVYENVLARPRAWMQPEGASSRDEYTAAEITRREANHITVSARGSGQEAGGLLVLAELDYPGWRAYVDGESRPIQAVEGLLRGVYLEPGEKQVDFIFRPVSLAVGLVLAMLGFALVIWRPEIRGQA